MSYAHITIDGNTILDGNLNQWTHKPPTELAKYLTPIAQHQPHATTHQPGINALLLAFATAAKTGQDFIADLTNTPDGYTLTVSHRPTAIALPPLNKRAETVAEETGATHWPIKP
jgi:hypothetical protein